MFWSSLSGIFYALVWSFFVFFCFGFGFVLIFSLFWNFFSFFVSVGILYLLSVAVVFSK